MTWDDVIGEAERGQFVGREHELAVFRQHLDREPPQYLIFFITGQGGVGKSTIMARYKKTAEALRFMIVECDERQRDVPSVLGCFARQLAEQGHHLKTFEERYRVYRQKMDEIEHDPKAPQGLAGILGRTLVRGVFVAGDLVPGLRQGLAYIPRDAMEAQAGEWATYLAQKLSNKDEQMLIQNPVATLTPIFFKDLNALTEHHRCLLCFENFEATREELQNWLLRLRENRPSKDIRLLIASRNPPGVEWNALRAVTLTIPLDVFTEHEAEQFLDANGIVDSERRAEILEMSGRLPVLMSWLAAPEGQGHNPALANRNIVERFLRWVINPESRHVALLAALPRSFNLDTLAFLLEKDEPSVARQAFDWLLTMPFVQPRADDWQYHPVVRRKMLHYQRQESPQTYTSVHRRLADFYDQQRNEMNLTVTDQWADRTWQQKTLAFTYHHLAAEPRKHWPEVMSLFTIALRTRFSFAVEIVELLSLEDVEDELGDEHKRIITLFRQQLKEIEEGDFRHGGALFDQLCEISGLSVQARAHALAYRGANYLANDAIAEALHDFSHAIELDPNDAWSLSSRGEIYRRMERYEESLADFNRAIELGPNVAWVIGGRGVIYRAIGRFDECLADLNRAIELDPNSPVPIANLGLTYWHLGRYEEALHYFDRAIELDPNLAWAIASRGRTYRLLGRYDEALADLGRAIELAPDLAWRNMTWPIFNRGLTYQAIHRYEESLADFNHAIERAPHYVEAIAGRGKTYRLLGRYEESLADLNRAIELEPGGDRLRYDRSLTYLSIGNVDAFDIDLSHAIELALAKSHDRPDDHQIAFNLALYRLAAALPQTEAQYGDLAITCLQSWLIQEAADDLSELLNIQPTNQPAVRIREHLQVRLIELRVEPR